MTQFSSDLSLIVRKSTHEHYLYKAEIYKNKEYIGSISFAKKNMDHIYFTESGREEFLKSWNIQDDYIADWKTNAETGNMIENLFDKVFMTWEFCYKYDNIYRACFGFMKEYDMPLSIILI